MRVLTERETWRKPKGPLAQRYTPDLTGDEHANVRRALQVLRRRFGSWEALASAMGAKVKTLTKAGGTNSKPSVGLALRAARIVGVPMEEILSGRWPKPGACPMCGRSEPPAPELPAGRP
jgi:DNA-binding XRE family transcriptional regulator